MKNRDAADRNRPAPHVPRHRQAHPPALARRLPHGGAPRDHGAGRQGQRRGLLRDVRRGLRAPLLLGPRGADRARGAAPLAAGRVHGRGALHAAVGPVLPRASSTWTTTSSPPSRRRSILLDGKFAYAEPLRLALQNLALGRPGPVAGVERRRRPRGDARPRLLGRDVGAPDEARERDLEAADDQVPLLDDLQGQGVRADGEPVRAPERPGLLVRDRARPRPEGPPDVPRLADPRRHPLRDAAGARLPPAGRLRPRRRTAAARSGSTATSSARPRSSSIRTRPGGSSGRSSAARSRTASSGRSTRTSSGSRRGSSTRTAGRARSRRRSSSRRSTGA